MDNLQALHSSVGRLRAMVEPLSVVTLGSSAYPSEWTIAQVLSHIGSGAVIMRRRLDDAMEGVETPAEFAPAVWDDWNAKDPRAQADDSLAADRVLLVRLDGLSTDERGRLQFGMGPMTFDYDQVVGLRLNEHALHTWDIEVALDVAAVLPAEIAALVVDNLELIARYTGKPAGAPATITVHTTEPSKDFTVMVTTDGATLESGRSGTAAELELPAEAFCRLVYGRLDRDHSPPGLADHPTVEHLRHVFPGP